MKKLMIIAAVLLPALAAAGIPPLDPCTVEGTYPGRVSVFCIPDGGGHPLTEAQAFGGTFVDGTIVLILHDDADNPVYNYPAEDLWLESSHGGMISCVGGTIADAPTDVDGRTTFSHPLLVGGHTSPLAGELMQVFINGAACPTTAGVDVQVNSPDLNGDLVVNLTDVIIMSGHLYGAYDYGSDFHYDGVINLSDIVMMAWGMGAACP